MKSSAIKKALSRNGNGGLLAVIAIVLIGLPLALPTINAFPAYIHAWSQSDWYSIALGFQNNGFDFFHPETLIYNKQFPGGWMVDCGDTITSVDFPIHEYVVALLMTLFGTSAPWVFRVWSLLCSLVGCWFVYLLSFRLTRSTIKSLAATMVYMTSPLYVYYFSSFLPCAPAMALLAAGMWAYTVYWQDERPSYWCWCIALLTLAAMVRTSHLVALVAVCGFEAVRIIRSETSPGWRHALPLVSVVAIGGYMLWNAHLRAEHGSMFLNALMPPRDAEEAMGIVEEIRRHWSFDYFSRLQHWLVAAACIGALLTMLFGRRVADKGDVRGRLSLGWLAAIWWVGECCFFVAMMRQYYDHDYYFLDSFYLPAVFVFILALGRLPAIKGHMVGAVCAVGLLLLGGTMFNNAKHKVGERCSGDDRALECSLNHNGADRWLDSIGVGDDARILSVFSYPQSSPFIQMGRKGYSLMSSDRELVEKAMRFPFDYVVIEDRMLSENFEEQSFFLGRLLPVARNGCLTLCLLSDTTVNHSAEEFFKVSSINSTF